MPLLRNRVRDAIVLLAACAIGLFAVPLAIAVNRVVDDEALTRLQRDATRALAGVPDNAIEVGAAIALPRLAAPSVLAVYDPAGRRVAGTGPATSALARQAADGRERDGTEAGQLTVVLPVRSDVAVAGTVRAAIPVAVLRERVLEAWAALLGLALLVLAVVFVVAGRVARRISRPFEALTDAARSLGSGSYDLALPSWGLAEADAAGAALQQSARQVGALVRHEREFTRHASHQLRTPLAGLLVGLETALAPSANGSGKAALEAALERARHLETTIDDLLVVRSADEDVSCDPVAVAVEVVERWRRTTSGRAVDLRADEVDRVRVPDAAVRQALDVLVDNALRHGAGRVTVTVEPFGERVVVEVADEGPGLADGAVPGVGLRLAAELAERFGGDLLVRRRAPHPRLALLLPAQSAS
ncbi:MAG: Histidine kinase [Frankiales bacterium]|nr:Histidine kinase [Frankiales bacterium]